MLLRISHEWTKRTSQISCTTREINFIFPSIHVYHSVCFININKDNLNWELIFTLDIFTRKNIVFYVYWNKIFFSGQKLVLWSQWYLCNNKTSQTNVSCSLLVVPTAGTPQQITPRMENDASSCTSGKKITHVQVCGKPSRAELRAYVKYHICYYRVFDSATL